MNHALESLAALLPRRPSLGLFLLRVALVDRRLATQLPRSEAAIHATCGALMLASAALTGVGTAWKLNTALFGGNPFGFIALFLFVFLFVLAIERVLIGTLQAGSRGNLALRFVIALLLAIQQVTPMFLFALQERIRQDLHFESLNRVREASELAASARGVRPLEVKAVELSRRVDVARDAALNPPPNAKVATAQKRANEAERALARAERDVAAALRDLDIARRAVANARSASDRERAEAIEHSRAVTITKRKAVLAQARALAENAKSASLEATQAWSAQLEQNLKEISELEAQQAHRLEEARGKFLADVAHADALARGAAKDDLANQLVALTRVIARDPFVALICSLALVLAVLLDVAPILAKYRLVQHGVLSRLVAHQVRETARSLAHIESLDELRHRRERLEEEMRTAGIELYSRTDGGATSAAMLAVDAQDELDRRHALGSTVLLRAGLDEIGRSIEALDRVEALAARGASTREVFAGQLRSLLARIEEVARLAAEDSTSASAAGKRATQPA